MSAWEWNHAVLRGRWPRIAKALDGVPLDECAVSTWGTTQALVYRNHQVTSAYDPLDRAKRQAEHLSRDEEAVYCYGIGLGHLPAVLAARHKTVCVVIMNATIARAAFESSPQKWLTAPHVGLVFAKDVDTLYVPYACVPMECRYADEQGHAMRDRLFAHRNQRFVEEFHFGVNAKRDASHVEDNRAHMAADNHVSSLFGTLSGKRAVIVGGGPSLMGEFDWLRGAKAEGATIIATTSVLKVLLANGVRPDVSVVVDTDPANIVQFDGLDMGALGDLALLYHPTVSPAIVEAWQGRRYYYNSPAELYTSGTVMHTAADLAAKMGAAEVVMLGMDFCYPAGKSHAEGTADFHEVKQRATLLETTDGHGQRAYTDPNLAQYHRHLESFIERRPEVKWRKRGRAGVSVRGAEWME